MSETATVDFLRQVSEIDLERKTLELRLADIRSDKDALTARRASLVAQQTKQEGEVRLLREQVVMHTGVKADRAEHLAPMHEQHTRLMTQEALLHETLAARVLAERAKIDAHAALVVSMGEWTPLGNHAAPAGDTSTQ